MLTVSERLLASWRTAWMSEICEASAPFVEHNTTVRVPLGPNGDFQIDDTLDSVPSNCPSPVLLIRNAGGVWFAAGIPRLGND